MAKSEILCKPYPAGNYFRVFSNTRYSENNITFVTFTTIIIKTDSVVHQCHRHKIQFNLLVNYAEIFHLSRCPILQFLHYGVIIILSESFTEHSKIYFFLILPSASYFFLNRHHAEINKDIGGRNCFEPYH